MTVTKILHQKYPVKKRIKIAITWAEGQLLKRKPNLK